MSKPQVIDPETEESMNEKTMKVIEDGRPKSRKPVRLTFKSVTEQDGIVWLRYLVDRQS